MTGAIKVGVAGYGNSAKRFHIPFIEGVPDLALIAILQRSAAPSDPATAPPGSHCTVDFPTIRHHRTAEDFFADANIDLVVVATSNPSHAPMAKMALEAGRHVIIDKPFTQSTEEADELIQLADKKGLIVTCFQNRRWDGDFQTLRRLLDAGALGDIKEAEVHYDFEGAGAWFPTDQDKYTPGSGMTFGLGTHSIDQAVVLFGRPKSVTGFLRTQRGGESEIEDSFTIILQYAGPQKDLLVTTQQRSTCVQEEQIASGMNPSDPEFGIEPATTNGMLTTTAEFDANHQKFDQKTRKYAGSYPTVPGRWLSVYENLAAAIRGTAELEVKATQVRDVLYIIELARLSHVEGCTMQWDQ
ncbi:hypothetical protein KJ359_009888 [Pestalotiopsis sp. 9143b]|nr:hypothetical protein KJ359_009888 [Pestalotiopsis sp. 9143b]